MTVCADVTAVARVSVTSSPAIDTAVGLVPVPASTLTEKAALAGTEVVSSASLNSSVSVVAFTLAHAKAGGMVSTLWAGRGACAVLLRLSKSRCSSASLGWM